MSDALENHDRIAALEADLATARNDALEEAAKVADAGFEHKQECCGNWQPDYITPLVQSPASAVRRLCRRTSATWNPPEPGTIRAVD